MLRTARAVPRSVVGAVLIDWDDRERVFQVGSKWKLSWGGLRHWVKQTVDTLPPRPFRVGLIVGNCVLFPAAAVREAGLMDAKRYPQFGDAEYTPRMRRLGWTLLIDPRAHVYCKPNDDPPRISEMTFAKAFRALFLDPYHTHSLRRRLNTTTATAPSTLHGYAAFAVFFARYLIGRNFERNWGREQAEPPLAEVYRDETVEI
jgi:GT2 family glycosyltransferase